MAKSEKFDLRIRAKDEASPVINKVKGSIKAFAVSLAVAGAAAAAFLKASIEAAIATEKAYADLAGTVKRSGGVWRDVEQDVRAFTGEMQTLTGVADETFAKGIQMFINYGLSGKEAFDTVRVVTDAAISQGVSIERQFRFFAEALGNSVIALKKYGVTLDLTQTNAEQFKDAIAQINRQFGGAAADRMHTTGVQLDLLVQQFGDLQEVIGLALLPVLLPMVESLSSLFLVLSTGHDTAANTVITLQSMNTAWRQQQLAASDAGKAIDEWLNSLSFVKSTEQANAEFTKRAEAFLADLADTTKTATKETAAMTSAMSSFSESLANVADQTNVALGSVANLGTAFMAFGDSAGSALDEINSKLSAGFLDIPVPDLAGFDFGPDLEFDLSEPLRRAQKELAEYSDAWLQTISDNASLWDRTTGQMDSSFSSFTDSLVDNMFGARLELQDVFKGIASDFIKFVLQEILRATARRAAFSILSSILPGFGPALQFGGSVGVVPFAPTTASASNGPTGKVVNINIEGNVIESTQFVRETLIPALQEANAFDVETFGPRG